MTVEIFKYFERSMAASYMIIPNSSARLSRLSHDGNYMASMSSKTKLTVYKRTTEGGEEKNHGLSVNHQSSEFVVCSIFTCQDNVDFIQWSPDSELIFAAQLKSAIVQVYSPEQPEFRCKITEGVAGLLHAAWAPDSRNLLTYADFNLHITIWNLTTQQSMTILKPKSHHCTAFSKCGSYFAVATRNDCKDSINILQCNTSSSTSSSLWEPQSTFSVPTLDLAAIEWSPDNGSIVLQDTCLRHSIMIYSPFGDLLGKYSAYKDALGVRSILFNKMGTFLAVGNFDQSVRLLNTVTWQENMELKHIHPKLLSTTTDLITTKFCLYQQCDYNEEEFMQVHHYENETEFQLDYMTTIDETKLIPKIGISFMEFNFDGSLLATKNENVPNILWIWDISVGILLCMIKTIQPIKCIQWSPFEESLLCFVIGSQHLHFWSPNMGCRSSNNIVSLVNQAVVQSSPSLSNIEVSSSSVNTTVQMPSNTCFNIIHFTHDGDFIHCVSPEMSVMVPRSQADEM